MFSARCRHGVFPAALALILVAAWAVADERAVEHRLSFPELEQQYVRVVSRFPAAGPQVDLRMSNWVPGSYKIRDFAAGLDRISVSDAQGKPLPFSKRDKSTWRVAVGAAEAVVVTYDVHAGTLSVRDSWVSTDFALINPATVVLYTDASRGLPQRVHVEPPPGLGRVFTSLPRQEGNDGWRARDFDELVDSPLVVSQGDPERFEVDGHRYALLNVGDDRFWDAEAALEGLEGVVRANNALWGQVPLNHDFWFFNFLVEGRGGLEHDHNTVLMTSRWNTRDREAFIKWLSLASHEYFHVWNVRRMRPAGIGTYDYESEQYTASLWIAEGLTSYYDNLLLSRGGLVTGEEYFQLLARDLHALELTPGRKLISVQQASRDAWIRQYGDSPNRINSNISYYTKGAVLGFVLDAHIRQETRDRQSLDDVMRLMYQRWSDTPYPEGAFLDAVATVAGEEVRNWFQPLLSTTVEPDLDAALAYFGLALDRDPGQDETPRGAGLGVNWRSDSPALIVDAVISGMAASAAGVVPGDELLALGGQRVRRDNLDDRLRRLQPGEAVELLISRHERVFEVPVVLDAARPERYDILRDEQAGRREARRLEAWLGQGLD